jgi:hypothetical protein
MNTHPNPKKLDGSIALGTSASNRHTKEMRARHASKISEIGEALRVAGFVALDLQAEALGLCRSTTWTLLDGKHKASGLSAALINRMLAAPQLPYTVRAKIMEYVEEKRGGLYGHSEGSLRRFTALLQEQRPACTDTNERRA